MWWSRTLDLIWSTDSNLKLNVIDVEENHRSMAIEIIKSGEQILLCIAVYSPVYPNSDVSEEKKLLCSDFKDGMTTQYSSNKNVPFIVIGDVNFDFTILTS